MEKLWNKNFTILTFGTLISKFGNSIVGFALSLFVLDYTKSTLMFALYLIIYQIPTLIMPALFGPFLDNFSRRKTIYTLDFISAGIFTLLTVAALSGNLNYTVVTIACALIGAIDSIYLVAYDSFFPLLITEGYFTKAYSISSIIESISPFLVPVSALLYNKIGIAPIFAIDAATFLLAAIFETRITTKEQYVKSKTESFGISQYKNNFLEGISYLKSEKGLLAIALYFTVSSFASGSCEALTLPFFKESFSNGEYIFMIVTGCAIFGRLIGGSVHYKYKYPTDKKFLIAIIVYVITCMINSAYLFLPITIMMALNFADGLLGVTSYNIRLSATQNYVPDDKKGRFNGIFQMLNMTGFLIGTSLSGFLGDKISDKRYIITAFMIINFIAVWLFIFRNRQHVKTIYNRQS